MRTVDLSQETMAIDQLLELARGEPVLLLTPDGKEFVLSEADDFEREVETLRSSEAFHRFLDERARPGPRISLDEIERQLEDGVSGTQAS